jgi:hypothetical protein
LNRVDESHDGFDFATRSYQLTAVAGVWPTAWKSAVMIS